MNQQEQERKIEKIVAKAMVDQGFKQKLVSNPATVLQAEGVELRPGVEIRVVENTDRVHHLLLPTKSAGKELSDDQLQQIAAGATAAHACW